jgi:hypothetical protein
VEPADRPDHQHHLVLGARPFSNSDNAAVQQELAMAAAITTLAALLLACGLGWLRFGRGQAYPWLPVCAAMICGYLLFNKVPLAAVRALAAAVLCAAAHSRGWILAYFVADAAIGIGSSGGST